MLLSSSFGLPVTTTENDWKGIAHESEATRRNCV
jgi:hypothetical protein